MQAASIANNITFILAILNYSFVLLGADMWFIKPL